jgi:hypothetical protein
VVVYVHLIGRSGCVPLSAKYIDRDLVLIYCHLAVITWLRCALYSVVLVAAVMQVL